MTSRRRNASLCQTESLEIRLVPAASALIGNVDIVQSGNGGLKIRADGDAPVRLDIVASDVGLRVIAGPGTTVNGRTEQFFEGARTIRGRLGDGDDVVTIREYNSVSGVSVSLNLGDGRNTFESHFIPLDSLTLTSGDGDDTFVIANTGCGTLSLRSGGGEDAIDFFHSSVDGPVLIAARDHAVLRLTGSRFGSPAPRLQNVTQV